MSRKEGSLSVAFPSKAGQCVRAGKVIRESLDVRGYGWVPKPMKVKHVHFPNRLGRCPSFKCDAVGGKKNSGPIASQPTVNENVASGAFSQEAEGLDELVIGGNRPAISRDVHEPHSERLSVLALSHHEPMSFAAKIDDGIDPEVLQFVDALRLWLIAPIQKGVQPSGIGDAMNLQLMSVPYLGMRDVKLAACTQGSRRSKTDQ